MVDTKKLRDLIHDNGLKYQFIATRLGITRYALLKKIENKTEFKPSEILKLCKLLKIESLEEREKIFFKLKVD